MKFPDNFMAKVRFVTETGCWHWMGGHDGKGYGKFRYLGKKDFVHRWVLRWAGIDIPPGMEVDHKCRNRSCCALLHLDVVTHTENMRRAKLTFCRRGHDKEGKRQCRECVRLAYVPKVRKPRMVCKRGHALVGYNLQLINGKDRVHRRCRKCSILRLHKYRGKDVAHSLSDH